MSHLIRDHEEPREYVLRTSDRDPEPFITVPDEVWDAYQRAVTVVFQFERMFDNLFLEKTYAKQNQDLIEELIALRKRLDID